jgi:enoyl-CoA hydratase/carnithine racemase
MLAAMKWAVANSQLKVIVQSGEGRFFTTGLVIQFHSRAVLIMLSRYGPGFVAPYIPQQQCI